MSAASQRPRSAGVGTAVAARDIVETTTYLAQELMFLRCPARVLENRCVWEPLQA
jgi:hypothetical protein